MQPCVVEHGSTMPEFSESRIRELVEQITREQDSVKVEFLAQELNTLLQAFDGQRDADSINDSDG